MRKLLALAVVTTFALIGADLDGTWKATAEGPNGKMERTFIFKVDGTKVTGETTSSVVGKSVIEDGKIDGEDVSFIINVKFQDNEMKLNYKGKVTGDKIKFTVENPAGGPSFEWTGSKVSS